MAAKQRKEPTDIGNNVERDGIIFQQKENATEHVNTGRHHRTGN